VSNAVRHSQATELTVTIEAGDHLTIAVVDNGIGLPADVARSGLAGVERRALQCGGTMTIGPRRGGGGTRLSWRVPL
jgi:two-component system, NarL family, sensor histidine kinase DevS